MKTAIVEEMLKFEITKIDTERRINGDSTVHAREINLMRNNEELVIKVPSVTLHDREKIRTLFIAQYRKFVADKEDSVKIGELI